MENVFVARDKELEFMESQYREEPHPFVVIYGRRRVGKTRLIEEFLNRHEDFLYYLGRKENGTGNLRNFRKAVSDFTGNAAMASSDMDWEDTISEFCGSRGDRRKILVIDEFQYIARGDPDFIPQFQAAWETRMGRSDVMLIICGSYVNMMRSLVLNTGSPLYGRRTGQIHLHPIGFENYGEFPSMAGRKDMLERYSVTGGVPKYIESFSKGRGIFEAIESNVLNPESYLFNEPLFLLGDEAGDVGPYIPIVLAVANGNRKLEDICKSIGKKSSEITMHLRNLRDMDILEREVPATEPDPEKSKLGLYRIKDNYIGFWFRFVYPYLDMLSMGRTSYVMDNIRRMFRQNWVAFVYEDVCRETMYRSYEMGLWDIGFGKVGRVWGKGLPETDIVAVNRQEKQMVVGECKYSSSPKKKEVLGELKNRRDALAEYTGYGCAGMIAFSNSGFTDDAIEYARKNGIVLVEGIDTVIGQVK